MKCGVTARKVKAAMTDRSRARTARRSWQPGFGSFAAAYAGFLAVDWWGLRRPDTASALDLYAAVFWTLPVYVSVLGL